MLHYGNNTIKCFMIIIIYYCCVVGQYVPPRLGLKILEKIKSFFSRRFEIFVFFRIFQFFWERNEIFILITVFINHCHCHHLSLPHPNR
jgi:hypothetical protein